MIIFNKISYKNFLSSGNNPTEIRLDKFSNTLIVGENGAGKSTMLDALCFVLYGKAFRKINKAQLVNTVNTKKCEVEIEFTVGKTHYRVFRSIKPSKFEIYCDGKLFNQDAKARDYQKNFETSVLQMSYETFCQVVILGSSTFVPFMQLSTHQRREIIENILDIKIFSAMNVLLKDRISENKESLTQNSSNVSLGEEKQKIYEKHIQELLKENATQLNDTESEIKRVQDEVKELEGVASETKSKIQSLLDTTTEKSSIEKRLTKIEALKSTIFDKRRRIATDILFYENNTNCPTCTQQIEEEFRRNKVTEMKEEQNKVDEGLEQIGVEVKKTTEELTSIQNTMDEVESLRSNIFENQTEVNAKNLHLDRLERSFKSIRDKSIDKETKKSLATVKKAIKKLQEQRKELLNEREVLGVAQEMLRDTGIKTMIIRQYIPVINKLIQKYLAAMDFFVDFHLDENFNETIKSRFRDDFSYASFSEGEKTRIDLAVLFTWRAIAKMRNSVNTNLLILDEIGDSSLDADGFENFLNIMNQQEKSNIFVISHKTDQLQDKFQDTIRFEKVKGFSRIS